MFLRSSDWIRSASEAERTAYLHGLLDQFERNNAEIKRLVCSIEQSHERLANAMERSAWVPCIYNEPLPPEPTRSGWTRLAAAGLVGHWLGSRHR